MKLKLAAALAITMAMQVGAAHAAFVPGMARWNAKGVIHQESYAASMLQQAVNASPAQSGLRTCVRKLGLDGKRTAKIMSSFYASHMSWSSKPPSTVFHMAVIRGVCTKFAK